MAGGDLVYISGVNFQRGLKVYFGTQEASGLVYSDTTKIRVTAPASTVPGDVDVTIINGDGKTIIKTNAYKYLEPLPVPAPFIDKFSLNGTTASNTVQRDGLVYVLGSGFVSGAKYDILNSSGDVVYPDLALNYYYRATKVRLRFPANITPGMYKVVMKNPDGQKSNVVDIEVTN